MTCVISLWDTNMKNAEGSITKSVQKQRCLVRKDDSIILGRYQHKVIYYFVCFLIDSIFNSFKFPILNFHRKYVPTNS